MTMPQPPVTGLDPVFFSDVTDAADFDPRDIAGTDDEVTS